MKASARDRAARAVKGDDIAKRDSEKKRYGAHRIERLADCTLDNSRPKFAIDIAAAQLAGQAAWRDRDKKFKPPKMLTRWLRDVVEKISKTQVVGLIAGGSLARSWLVGWSDIDWVVIHPTLQINQMIAIRKIIEHPEIKTGISWCLPDELQSGIVTAEVREAAAAGAICLARARFSICLHQGFPLPNSASNLPQLLQALRRLTTETTKDIRQIHRHVGTICVVLCNLSGFQVSDRASAISKAISLGWINALPRPNPTMLPDGKYQQKVLAGAGEILRFWRRSFPDLKGQKTFRMTGILQ